MNEKKIDVITATMTAEDNENRVIISTSLKYTDVSIDSIEACIVALVGVSAKHHNTTFDEYLEYIRSKNEDSIKMSGGE